VTILATGARFLHFHTRAGICRQAAGAWADESRKVRGACYMASPGRNNSGEGHRPVKGLNA
jgi:hypothetical protein